MITSEDVMANGQYIMQRAGNQKDADQRQERQNDRPVMGFDRLGYFRHDLAPYFA
jgi:hypothetical protein